MHLTITLPDTDVQALRARADAQGVTAEQYAEQVLARDLAPDWLRQSWEDAHSGGVDQLSIDEIEAEIAAARRQRREINPPSGS